MSGRLKTFQSVHCMQVISKPMPWPRSAPHVEGDAARRDVVHRQRARRRARKLPHGQPAAARGCSVRGRVPLALTRGRASCPPRIHRQAAQRRTVLICTPLCTRAPVTCFMQPRKRTGRRTKAVLCPANSKGRCRRARERKQRCAQAALHERGARVERVCRDRGGQRRGRARLLRPCVGPLEDADVGLPAGHVAPARRSAASGRAGGPEAGRLWRRGQPSCDSRLGPKERQEGWRADVRTGCASAGQSTQLGSAGVPLWHAGSGSRRGARRGRARAAGELCRPGRRPPRRQPCESRRPSRRPLLWCRALRHAHMIAHAGSHQQ